MQQYFYLKEYCGNIMSLSPSRKNKWDLKAEKENYVRHLNRLQKLSHGRSPDHVKREVEEKKILNNMIKLRKIHESSRHFQIRQMQNREQQIKSINFNRVKSVIKKQISKAPLSIPPKHKVKLKPILDENQKMFSRLIHIKSKFDFHSEPMTHRKQKSNIYEVDFQSLYKASTIYFKQNPKFTLKLGSKSKKQRKIKVEIQTEALSEVFNFDGSFVSISAAIKGFEARTPIFLPSDSQRISLKLQLSEKIELDEQISVQINKILDNKSLNKGYFTFSISQVIENQSNESSDQSNQNPLFIQKVIFSPKGKPQSIIAIKFTPMKVDSYFQSLAISRQKNKTQICRN